MCGIWGFVDPDEPTAVADAWDGLCSIDHRGPDAWGFYTDRDGTVTEGSTLPSGGRETFLGNRRLSVIDTSASGNQPMVRDGVVLVYNGEVYNYERLRNDLQGRGYSFESDSDTEVVLAAYREYGVDCVDRFRGMFAFAVYDRPAEQLLLVRDPLGIKPLYVTDHPGGLAFASEVTSLLAGGVVPRRLNERAVGDFLRVGYVPGPETIVEGVRSVPAGSTLTYDLATGERATDSYWQPEFDGDATADAGTLHDRLSESVSRRLVSDVPLGMFLSGGLDSSTVVTLAAEDGDESVHTCSVGFGETEYNESEYAREVAEMLGTEHRDRVVGPEDVREALPAIVDGMDQPSVDAVNTYFVSETAVQSGLTVAMSGLGSDELLYGYPTFEYIRRLYPFARVASRLPNAVTRVGGRVLSGLDDLVSSAPLSELADVVQSSASFGASYLAVRGLFTESERARLAPATTPDTDLADRVEADVAETLEKAGVGEATSHAELTWYMREQLLRDTDTMSMSHSLEVRVPFLDRSVVEYLTGQSTPSKRDGGEKSLLKRAVADRLPDSVINREKSGFVFPFDRWLSDELSPVVDDALTPAALEPTPLDAAAARQIRAEFEAGERHWTRLWALVVLSLWVNRHLVEDESDQTREAGEKEEPIADNR